MCAYPKSEQHNKQAMTADARVPYESPTLTVMGKVERLTAVGFRGPKDLLGGRNLL
jgi:hypothetical protein